MPTQAIYEYLQTFEETEMLTQVIVAERPRISVNSRQKLAARNSAVIVRVGRFIA